MALVKLARHPVEIVVAGARAGAVTKPVDVHTPAQLARERDGHHAGGGALLLHAYEVAGDRTHERRRDETALWPAAPVEWLVAADRIERRARRARHRAVRAQPVPRVLRQVRELIHVRDAPGGPFAHVYAVVEQRRLSRDECLLDRICRFCAVRRVLNLSVYRRPIDAKHRLAAVDLPPIAGAQQDTSTAHDGTVGIRLGRCRREAPDEVRVAGRSVLAEATDRTQVDDLLLG
eukprot:scaffold17928_cov67-Phaeocystis_antarctica.AAC.4